MKHSSRFLQLCHQIMPDIQEIDCDSVKSIIEKKENVVLIDVRENSEVKAGIILSALHLSKGILERDIEKTVLDPNQKIILYCGGGFRSAIAAYLLQKMGYTNVLSMKGGFREWSEKNFPLQNR